MTQEEQIRLYRLMEKLNWFFHQEMHYLVLPQGDGVHNGGLDLFGHHRIVGLDQADLWAHLDGDIAEQTAQECYPEIREFTYNILWNDLPKEMQEQLMDEEKL